MKLRKYIPMLVISGVMALLFGAVPARADWEMGVDATRSFYVNSMEDQVDVAPGDNKCKTAFNTCTLRAAVQEGNARVGTDIITLPVGIYKLEISGSDNTAKKGDLDVKDGLYIQGSGMHLTVIDGNHLDRVFHVTGAKTQLTLKDLTVRNGDAGTGVGGAIWNDGAGLGLWATIIRDSSADKGGGIYNSGVLYVYFSTLDNNTAYNGGGGLFSTGDSEINLLMGASILRNGSATHGGGIWNEGSVLIVYNSTLAQNYANQNGGGFYNTWSTPTPNQVAFIFTTIAENIADADGTGGGGGGMVEIGSGQITLTSTLVANNHDNTSLQTNNNEDCYGQFESAGHNLLGIAEGCTGLQNGVNADLVGTANAPLNPKTSPLGNYGGLAETISLQPTSPALNAGGSPDYCTVDGPFNVDQRGYARNVGGNCDIGADEFGATCATPLIVSPYSPWFKQKLKSNSVTFEWLPANCATSYNLIVRQKSQQGKVVLDVKNIAPTSYTAALPKGKKYAWSVVACNASGCSNEMYFLFKIKK